MSITIRIASCCILAIGVASAECSEISGIVFNLPDPNLSPITDQEVIIKVFGALTQGGRLIRDENTGQLIKSGAEIASGRSISDGSYHVSDIPDVPRTVIIEFNRSGEAVTQRLEGIVVSARPTLLIDAIVPKQSQMSKPAKCHPHPPAKKHCKLRRKCRR